MALTPCQRRVVDKGGRVQVSWGLLLEIKMGFYIGKWFGTASAVMWILPVSCGDGTAKLEVLNISVNLRCDPHLQSDVGSGCKAQITNTGG